MPTNSNRIPGPTRSGTSAPRNDSSSARVKRGGMVVTLAEGVRGGNPRAVSHPLRRHGATTWHPERASSIDKPGRFAEQSSRNIGPW